MAGLDTCPYCGKLISLRFPIHTCSGPPSGWPGRASPPAPTPAFRKVRRPSGNGNGFGRTPGAYAVLVDGKERGKIEGLDNHTWWTTVDGRAPHMSGSYREAKAVAVRLLAGERVR